MKRWVRPMLLVTFLALAAAGVDWALREYVGRKAAPAIASSLQGTSRPSYRPKPAVLFTQTFAEERSRAWRPTPIRGFIALRPNAWYAETEGSTPSRAGDIRIGKVRWRAQDNDSPLGRLAVGGPAHDPQRGLIFVPGGPRGVNAVDDLTFLTVWSKADAPASSVAVVGDLVVTLHDRVVRARDALTGEQRWSFTADDAVTTGLVGSPDAKRVVLSVTGASEGRLFALNAASGQVVWSRPLPFATPGAPAVGNGRVIVSGYVASPWATVITATNLNDGQPIWESRFSAAELGSPPFIRTGPESDRPLASAIDDASVYQPIDDQLLALDATTGVRRWLWRRVARDEPASDFRRIEPADRVSSPLIDKEQMIVAINNGAVAINAGNGKETWRSDPEGPLQNYSSRRDVSVPQRPTRMGDVLFVVSGASFGALRTPDAQTPTSTVAAPLTAQPIGGLATMGASAFLVSALIVALLLHRLRMGIALISLLLLAGSVYLWLDSYQATHFIGTKEWASAQSITAERRRGIHSQQGRLLVGDSSMLWRDFFGPPIQGDPSHLLWMTRSGLDDPTMPPISTRYTWLNSSRPSGSDLGPQAIQALVIPHWPLAALFALAPLAWLTGSWRDRKRHPKGHCHACGYDLRASEGGGCPECGHGMG